MKHEKPKGNLVWRAAEYHSFRRDVWWRIGVVVVCLVLAGIFVLMESYLAAVGMIAMILVIFQVSAKHPKTIEYKLTPEGMEISNRAWAFKDFKSFWIHETKMGSTLYFEPKNIWRQFISINLGTQKPDRIREYLQEFMPEEITGGELFHDQLIRIFKL